MSSFQLLKSQFKSFPPLAPIQQNKREYKTSNPFNPFPESVDSLDKLEHPCYYPLVTDQTSSPPKRKRGAPLGNTNAVTHGFYSRQFRTADLDDVQDCSVASLKDEIDMLRVHIRRLIQLGEDIDDYDKFANLLRILCLASTSLNRLIRTQHIITPQRR